MTLLIHNEELTNTLGFLQAFKYEFGQNNDPVEIDKDIYILPVDKNRLDIKHIQDLKSDWMKEDISFKNLESYGTYVLHKLDKKRPLKNVWESLDKFHHLSLTVRLLSQKKCDNLFLLYYD